ncbi:5-amino-6-(5-phospho-D-ribitylamino)uracil phosphatase YigB [Vibrio sp. SCSIO 43136]|uniref:5-amino-6-(5-phospho-D-ribitylamino)uracil phosphatase YigB n=1 Tax=Vibrio sp. SCSIO 43136 TaxID=2819101 RepID=UPI00207551FD|nr:5-amino-6-(5-phospho-D-ribitylamino)uracil phosphatase YigB [Vibrio sp. SCSIO 43136]USD65369.1 5-amino-6-(5-phospho-D-ribitylamino)uracil phosphatase YigB [Vibrio sp. SCSIO 43136]
MQFYRKLPAVKAMSFDLDDTLYDNLPVILRLEKEVRAWVNQHYPKSFDLDYSQWQALKRQVIVEQPELVHDVSLWRYTQLKVGLTRCGYSPQQAEQAAQRAMEQVSYWRNKVQVPELTHHVLQALSANMPLIAITNGNVDVEAIGLSGYFSHVLRAGPDGRQKPHSDMFDEAARLLKVPAKHILHVGDHLTSDVLGAKSAGMSAAWIHHNALPADKMRILPDLSIATLDELLALAR